MVEVLPTGFKPPIMEAVLEIECDMPQNFDVQSIEVAARTAFSDSYPTLRKQMHATFQVSGPEPQASMSRGLQALQFLQLDEKQLVQVRAEGFAFNRLAPYSSMDDYLGEIRRTFTAFVELASPLQLRRMKLRYINRLPLPAVNGRTEVEGYLNVGKPFPGADDDLQYASFFNRYQALDPSTGSTVNVIMTNQALIGDRLPVVLDIETQADLAGDPKDWAPVAGRVQDLRSLAKRVFARTITEQCLLLFL